MKLRDMINTINNDLTITLVFQDRTPLRFEYEARGRYIEYGPAYKTIGKYLDNEVIGMYIISNKRIKLSIKGEQ